MTTPGHNPQREDGFTLVELLVGVTVSLIVLLATLTSLDAFSSNAAHQTRATDANGQVRSIMDRTVTDLRGASLILTAGATDLAYAVPTSPTTTRVERLCVASEELYGSSTADDATPTAPIGACSGTKIATLKSTTSTAFSYDSATTGLVKNVGLTFSLDASANGRTASSVLRASAARRSAGTLPATDDDVEPICNEDGALLTLSADILSLGAISVTYTDGTGNAIGTITAGGVQIGAEVTTVIATITNAAGLTKIIEKDVECD